MWQRTKRRRNRKTRHFCNRVMRNSYTAHNASVAFQGNEMINKHKQSKWVNISSRSCNRKTDVFCSVRTDNKCFRYRWLKLLFTSTSFFSRRKQKLTLISFCVYISFCACQQFGTPSSNQRKFQKWRFIKPKNKLCKSSICDYFIINQRFMTFSNHCTLCGVQIMPFSYNIQNKNMWL